MLNPEKMDEWLQHKAITKGSPAPPFGGRKHKSKKPKLRSKKYKRKRSMKTRRFRR
jgi:hypothetical protein